MTRSGTVDLLLDERARLIAKNAATSGDLWMAELLLTRTAKLLKEAIMPTPALSAHRDVIIDEIRELLAEDRDHPAADVTADDTWPPTTSGGGAGEGEDPVPSSGDGA